MMPTFIFDNPKEIVSINVINKLYILIKKGNKKTSIVNGKIIKVKHGTKKILKITLK